MVMILLILCRLTCAAQYWIVSSAPHCAVASIGQPVPDPLSAFPSTWNTPSAIHNFLGAKASLEYGSSEVFILDLISDEVARLFSLEINMRHVISIWYILTILTVISLTEMIYNMFH